MGGRKTCLLLPAARYPRKLPLSPWRHAEQGKQALSREGAGVIPLIRQLAGEGIDTAAETGSAQRQEMRAHGPFNTELSGRLMTNPREWALNAGQDLGGTGDKGKVQDKREEGNVCLHCSSLKSKLYKKVIKFLKCHVFMLSIHFSRTSRSGKDKLWNQKAWV